MSLGWVLLIIYLVSGFYYNKLLIKDAESSFRPIEWNEHKKVFKGIIQCTLSDADLQERKQLLKEKLFSKVASKEETANEITYYFNYDDQLLDKIFEFTRLEKACCPFFNFDISILPFELGMAIRISGSDEAIEMLKDFEESD